MTSTPQFSPSEPIAEEFDAEIFSEHEPQCRVIDLNIVALILEKVAAACREIAQSGDSEALQNFDPFEFLRVPVTVAANLTRGQQAGLTLSGGDVVRICREITRAMGARWTAKATHRGCCSIRLSVRQAPFVVDIEALGRAVQPLPSAPLRPEEPPKKGD